MAEERIIPITIEGQDEPEVENSDNEKNLTKPMEKLTIKQRKPSVQIKPAVQIKQKSDESEKYLKEFEVFEDRSNYSLYNANIPEKIILAIDRAQDENYTPFLINNGKCTPLSMLKRVIQVFIKIKHTINKEHEFAIVVLNENNAHWLINFTSDLRKLNLAVDRISECEVEDSFNLNSLFDVILENIEQPAVISPELPPPFLIRTVLFYGRSYTIPKLEMNDKLEHLLDYPYFICDVLMSHEPVDKANHCKKIFESLQNLDKKGYAYFFPVCRDARRLHTYAGKLLGHPLQRPIQKYQKV